MNAKGLGGSAKDPVAIIYIDGIVSVITFHGRITGEIVVDFHLRAIFVPIADRNVRVTGRPRSRVHNCLIRDIQNKICGLSYIQFFYGLGGKFRAYQQSGGFRDAGNRFGTDGNGTFWYSSDGQEFSGGSAEGFSDFFEQMFGHHTRNGRRTGTGFRGQDYHADLELSLREAAQTHKQVLTIGDKQIRITIPAGVANGQVIKLKGYGSAGINGGPAGDLYITFVIPDDPMFHREGDDLYVNVPIDLYTALLGGEQIVDTLNGKVRLKVNAGTQNGTKVRLKGKGFPVYKQEGTFGDLIVTYTVMLPTHLSEQQKEMFRKIQTMN